MFLILLTGEPATGKSGLAKWLGKKLKAPVLDKDIVKSSLLTRGETDWNRSGSLAYTIVRDLGHSLLEQGFNVVVDSPGHYLSFQVEMAHIAQKLGADLRIVECKCEDEKKRRKNLDKRKKEGALPAQLTSLEEVMDQVEMEEFRPQGLPALHVDTCESQRKVRKLVSDYLAKKPPKWVAEEIEPSTIKTDEDDPTKGDDEAAEEETAPPEEGNQPE